MPKISIIVPVYKAECHIRRCLESLLLQTFNNWECILVDDGSPDNSGIICQQYSQRDPRFKTIKKQNGGVSSARNVGLQSATGEYVTFLDSDDRLANNTLEVYNKCMDEATDVVIVGTTFEDDDGNLKTWRSFKDQKLTRSDDCGLLLRYGSVCGKMYRRKTIVENNICFNETICNGEDCLFFWNYLEKVHTISLISYCGYYYYKPANVTTLTNSIGDPHRWFRSYRLLKDEFNEKIVGEYTINDEDLHALKAFIASLAHNAMRAAYSRKIKRADRRTIYLEYRQEYRYISKKTIKGQIESILMTMPFTVYDYIQMMIHTIKE